MQTGSENGNGAAAPEGALHVAFVLGSRAETQGPGNQAVLLTQAGCPRRIRRAMSCGVVPVWAREPGRAPDDPVRSSVASLENNL